MNYLFTICARAGSKGFKNKNLKKMLNIPLVYYTIASIIQYRKMYGYMDNLQIILNTDSEELTEIVNRQQAIEIFSVKRNEALAGDRVPKVSVIKDCLDRAESEFGEKYDMVIDLDITSPLRTAEDIKNAIDKKKMREDTDVVYSVTYSRRNPYFNMVKEQNGYFVKAMPADFIARQQAPVFYDMNASIYAYSPQALRSKDAGNFFNDGADAVLMRDTAVLDIDSKEDFELMGVVAEYLFKNYAEYHKIFELAIQLEL